MSALIHQPGIVTAWTQIPNLRLNKISFVCECGGNPQYLVIPALLISVKTTFHKKTGFVFNCAYTLTLTGPKLLGTHAMAPNQAVTHSRLLPDTIKHCETIAGLPVLSPFPHIWTLILFSDKHGQRSQWHKVCLDTLGEWPGRSRMWQVICHAHCT